MDYLGDFYVALYDAVLQQVTVDACFIWEDMCYKNGPLISPEMFRIFMLPHYEKLTTALRDHGVAVIMVDCDGDARKLIPSWMEGGVNMLLPCEVNAGMDVVALRKAFPTLRLLGGIDKTKIAAGRDAIDKELARKIPYMLERGGYIPTVDHQVPPDVSWGSYKYYRQTLNTMIDSFAGRME
jgi:uroporphyrinogen decarboxylase